MTYVYLGTITDREPPANSDVSNTLEWTLENDEVYSRDVLGREVAIYQNNDILQYPIYGLDLIGKIDKDVPYYYFKDHLGSIRALTNSVPEVISAQDYDQWGYLMEERTFESGESKFKFTSKERDTESHYDYFGARYYDPRVGYFRSSEPIPSSSFGWSSYVYCADNPLRIIDPTGEEWYYIYDEEGGGGSWEYDDVERKNIWNGTYDEKGNKIIEWTQGYKELLYFQGNQLQWLKENGQIEFWFAVSGELDKFGKTNPLFQYTPNVGPTPDGWWVVDPTNAYSKAKAQDIIDNLKWEYLRKGPFGEAYINIYPTPDNPTLRREGFSIHGGDEPGSIGCIDLTSSMNDFYQKFTAHNKSMLLNVDYSKFIP